MSPLSNTAALTGHQVTPLSPLEISTQRWAAIQLRFPALSWSLSSSMTPHGTFTIVLPPGISNPKPKCTPSFSTVAVLSTVLMNSTEEEPATRRISRTSDSVPGADDVTSREVTTGPFSFTATSVSDGLRAYPEDMSPFRYLYELTAVMASGSTYSLPLYLMLTASPVRWSTTTRTTPLSIT